MKSQKALNNKDLTEALFAITDPECQLNSGEILKVFKKNLELLRDTYLQLTEAEFYLDVSGALEQTKFRLNSVDPLQVDWFSRDPLLNYYEAYL
jgi:hypothetical protein